MFFEAQHSTKQGFFNITVVKNDRGFPLHIHRAFECYAVTEGCATVSVDGKSCLLNKGEAVLVFPYQSHEYKTMPGTSTWVCIFSPDMVEEYGSLAQKCLPTSSKFLFTPSTDSLEKTHLLKKAICYEICAKFDLSAEYIERSSSGGDLLSSMLLYISKNFNKKCSLKDLALHLGYDYNYLSKLFKREVGQSFNSFLNNLRITEACHLLEEGVKIQSVLELVGYSCMRTFNREFRAITGTTPSAYLKRGKP